MPARDLLHLGTGGYAVNDVEVGGGPGTARDWSERASGSGHDVLPLFEPDVLLPDQFFTACRRTAGIEPERLLMLAVLEEAVESYRACAFARDARSRQTFAEAQDWFESTDRGWLFAFESICDVLEIDAGYIRGRLREWRLDAALRRRHAHLTLLRPPIVPAHARGASRRQHSP